MERMAKSKTIYWDIGGVLLTNGWDENERARVLGKYRVDMAETEPLHDEENPRWERGEITAAEYFARTIFFKPRDFTFQQLWEDVKAESVLLHPECFEILRTLANAKQHTLAVLSNESRELNAHRYAKWNLPCYFDYFVSSCYVGHMKPDLPIYRMALDLAQTDPQDTIFIDDRERNTHPAASLGMDAIRFTGPQQLREELKRRGIEI